MAMISYDGADYPVVAKYRDSHNRFWSRLAKPGAWFTAAERVAIAGEVRQARHRSLCQRRTEALSPTYVHGQHDGITELPEVVIEVIHRVTTDPARLTKSWFDGILSEGLSEERYIEIIGTLVSVVNIDDFCLGIGVAEHSLPEPEDGAPSYYRPSSASAGSSWVSMIDEKDASGDEKDLYGDAPRAGNVIKALSLVPDEVRTLWDMNNVHYVPLKNAMDVRISHGGLNRLQIELLASRVASLNGCFY